MFSRFFLWNSCFPGGIQWLFYLSLTRDVAVYHLMVPMAGMTM